VSLSRFALHPREAEVARGGVSIVLYGIFTLSGDDTMTGSCHH
jgi:hypothetical protein